MLSIKDCIAEQNNLKASFYSINSLEREGTTKFSKNIMANGKRFDENALTCATRLYPLGTNLKITNPKNKKSVTVKVTDRIGKRFATSRIDLSKAAFKEIADLKQGLVEINVEVV
jgi:rare lipoprotein A